MTAHTRTYWHGVAVCSRLRDMLDEIQRLYGAPVDIAQGSWHHGPKSAGTHDGCGAADLLAPNLARLEAIARRVGCAAWHRTTAQGFDEGHVHAIAVGCPGLSKPAAAQVDAYHNGRDGLARSGRDTGPRTYATRTWETYQLEEDMPLTDHDYAAIAARVWATPITHDIGGGKLAPFTAIVELATARNAALGAQAAVKALAAEVAALRQILTPTPAAAEVTP